MQLCTSIIGKDQGNQLSYYGDLFGEEFDTSAPIAESVSQPEDYGFVDRYTTDDGTGIPGGFGGGAGQDCHAIFYVGVPDVEAASSRPRGSVGRAGWIPRGTREKTS